MPRANGRGTQFPRDAASCTHQRNVPKLGEEVEAGSSVMGIAGVKYRFGFDLTKSTSS